MTTVLLVRHGRSSSNSAGVLSGRLPGVALDDQGRTQAERLGERLRGVSLARVVRSPQQRCRETLELALGKAHISPEVLVDEQLDECDYGDWSGRTLAELATERLWATVQQQPSQVRFPSGESMVEMQSRIVAAVQQHNQCVGEDATWLLVGHGDPIKALLAHALGMALDDFQRIVVDPASVSVVRWQADRPPLVLAINTTSGPLADVLGGAQLGAQLGGGTGNQTPGAAEHA